MSGAGRVNLTKSKVRKVWKQSLDCWEFFLLLFFKETFKKIGICSNESPVEKQVFLITIT